MGCTETQKSNGCKNIGNKCLQNDGMPYSVSENFNGSIMAMNYSFMDKFKTYKKKYSEHFVKYTVTGGVIIGGALISKNPKKTMFAALLILLCMTIILNGYNFFFSK